jgi:putative heme-binding domain-containing protein
MGIVLLSSSPAVAQNELKDIPDPDPELERQSFILGDGLEVNLYSADPGIKKPIQMNFDAAGRLWIASSEVYPQIKPGQAATDKILVVEDTDGDGTADKTTVFVDGLLIPTGVAPGDGGAYVANSTELVHFVDTDNDGKADKKRVLLSGFGTEDTHHIIHTFRWGMDGMLYFNQSIYIHSHVETPWGIRRLGGGGIWQFRPETHQLEVLCRGFVNAWGHHFDAWGQSFATDGAYGEGINYVFPGSVFVTAPGATRILKGLNPGSPKHCGLEIVSGRHLPDDWQGNAITNDFRGHRVCRFVLSDDGSGYSSREQQEIIKTTHVAFRPIDVKMGPDGAIYVADWYNPIIQHGEVDFRDPRRDRTHGRIWRVTHKGRPLVPRPRLVDATVRELLDQLKAPEEYTRLRAKQVLKERGADAVLPELDKWVAALGPINATNALWHLEALWTYQSLDVPEPKQLLSLLRFNDDRVKAAAIRVLSAWRGRITTPDWPGDFALLREAVQTPGRPRLEAVRALAHFPTVEAAAAAMSAADGPLDQWLDFATWQTARDLAPVWLPVVTKENPSALGNARRTLFALKAVNTPGIVPAVVGLLKTGELRDGSEAEALNLLATLGGPADLRLAYDIAADDKTSDGQRMQLLGALFDASVRRGVQPAGDLSAVLKLLTHKNDALRRLVYRLAGAWKQESARAELERVMLSGEAYPERQAAIEGLLRLGGVQTIATLRAAAAEGQPAALRLAAAAGLASVSVDEFIGDIVASLQENGPSTETAAVFSAVIDRKGGGDVLVAALAGKRLPSEAARTGLRVALGSARDLKSLVESLKTAGQIQSGERMLSPEELQAMVAEVKAHGDAARGERVFRRMELTCLKCHAIAGAGGVVGPDMTSIGASAQTDYLIESLLTPNKAIKEGYHAITVLSTNGSVKSGQKVRESETEIVLRTADDEEVTIPVAEIEEQSPAGSLMPAGLTDELPHGEFLDLVRFLSELGKQGPYAPSSARLARRWEVLSKEKSGNTNFNRFTVQQTIANPEAVWTSAYSQVQGTLPLSELPRLHVGADSAPTSIVRCQVTVTTPGPAVLGLNSVRGVQAWLDDVPLFLRETTPLDLSTGQHTLTFAISRSATQTDLRVELLDPPVDSNVKPAAVQFVLGK